MPYQSIDDLPKNVAGVLPKHAQDIFKEAYNSAWQQYKDADDRRGEPTGKRRHARRLERRQTEL